MTNGSMFPATSRTYSVIVVLACAGALALFGYWDYFFHFQRMQSVAATVASGLGSMILLVSAVHLWRGFGRSPLGATVFVIVLSAVLSGFWLFVYYPGTISFDAISMWMQASANDYSAWHPPAMAMLMHVTQRFVSDSSLFNFLGGWLFWGSIVYLVRQVAGAGRRFLVICGLLALVPPLWLYSSAAVSNTWTASFASLSAACLIRSIRERDRRFLVLAVAAVSAATLFRREAAILIVVVIGSAVWSFGDRRRWWLAAGLGVLTLVAVRVPGSLVEASPLVRKSDANPAGQGLLNHYVGTIAYAWSSMSEDELARERQSIDSTYGEGKFDELVSRYVCYSSAYIVWDYKGGDEGPAVLKGKSLIRNGFAVRKIVQTALRHPIGFLEHEACYAAHLAQFSDLYYDDWGTIYPRRMPRMRKRLGIQLDSRLPAIYGAQQAMMRSVLEDPVQSLLVRHYIFLFGTVVALVVGVRMRRAELVVPAMFGLIYPMAFVVAGPSTPWRYLLPTYVMAWILMLTVAGDALEYVWRRTRSSVPSQK